MMASKENTRETGHICPTCSRSFSRIENLKRHQKTHRSSLPHRCNICLREFSRSDLLKKHQRLHQQRQGDGTPVEESQTSTLPERVYPFILEDPSVLPHRLMTECGEPQGLTLASARSQCLTDFVRIEPSPSVIDPPVFPRTVSPTLTACHGSGMPQLPGTKTNASWTSRPYSQEMCLSGSENKEMNIDCSTFVRSWADNGCLNSSQWFTSDFYDAVRETTSMNDPLIFFGSYEDSFYTPDLCCWTGQDTELVAQETDTVPVCHEATAAPMQVNAAESISRVSSPPNVPSHEDGIAFAWNPSSETLSQTQPISISERHPLLLNHTTRFDMDESTWARIRDFLKSRAPNRDSFILPSLAVANVFLGLFFEHFYEQSPVLHLPTLASNSLPPSLLSAMIVIGATYSRIRHTRRFSILMLNRARQNLQQSIEDDRSLPRDPQIIYAFALMCYTGLWCGNKGAFEIAEASRGTLVTFVRRLPLPKSQASDTVGIGDEHRWKEWVHSEFRRRLRWYVFMIDSQFPAILNMRSMMSLGEIRMWECPSNEEYWSAPHFRAWEGLLDSASQPAAPVFSVAYRALLDLDGSISHASPLPSSIPRFSRWTSFLVLSCLASQALDWSHDWDMHVAATPELVNDSMSLDSFLEATPDSSRPERLTVRGNILASLDIWYSRCATIGATPPDGTQSADYYFQRASRLLHGLVCIQLHTSLSDIQDALGKGGAHAVHEGLSRLRSFFIHGYASRGETRQKPPPESMIMFHRAIADSVTISSDQSLQLAAPYSIFGIFLNHALLWALIKASPETLRAHLGAQLGDIAVSSATVASSELKEVLDFALSPRNGHLEDDDRSHVILMHAAQSLARLGTWGASLNLALLLQLRAKT